MFFLFSFVCNEKLLYITVISYIKFVSKLNPRSESLCIVHKRSAMISNVGNSITGGNWYVAIFCVNISQIHQIKQYIT